jgi:hypothetical protein
VSADVFPLPIPERTDFDPETVDVLAGAFEDAWRAVVSSGSPLAKPRYQNAAREIVARRILDQALSGERDRTRLSDDAIAYLGRTYQSKD